MYKVEFTSSVLGHAPTLKNYALHFTRNEHDADDLVQDTLLKAITYYEKFKPGTNLNGWLYTIMKNTFTNKYHRTKKNNKIVSKSEEIQSVNLVYSATKNKGESNFVMADIQNAIDKLSERYYNPFIMYFEGYKYLEIADHMKIPIGTVKTRIHIARKLLKRSLENYS